MHGFLWKLSEATAAADDVNLERKVGWVFIYCTMHRAAAAAAATIEEGAIERCSRMASE
jgi:hypothetical protein